MAGIRTENKIYEVGIYCRLSKDDGTDNESASIATQKSILTDYVKRQGWHLAKTYVDDGYSGTNFQRPSFQNMIKDIENGLINCVITKDLSRLGRNYLCLLYTSGQLDMDMIFSIMTEEKGNQKETLKINTSKLKKYFPKDTTPKQMEETIIRLLERELQRKRSRDSR